MDWQYIEAYMARHHENALQNVDIEANYTDPSPKGMFDYPFFREEELWLEIAPIVALSENDAVGRQIELESSIDSLLNVDVNQDLRRLAHA